MQILTAPKRYNTAHLGVALSNNRINRKGEACPVEELLSPENDNNKAFCCCPSANDHSFLIEWSRESQTFDIYGEKSGAFQELHGYPKSVRLLIGKNLWLHLIKITGNASVITFSHLHFFSQVSEMTQLQTEKCCPVFQTVSPLGETHLYTLEYNQEGDLTVYTFLGHGLPAFVESSSYGYCDDNDLIVSYQLHSFQSGGSGKQLYGCSGPSFHFLRFVFQIRFIFQMSFLVAAN